MAAISQHSFKPVFHCTKLLFCTLAKMMPVKKQNSDFYFSTSVVMIDYLNRIWNTTIWQKVWVILFQNCLIKMTQVMSFFCSSVYVKESLNNLFYRNFLNFYIQFEMLHLGVGVLKMAFYFENTLPPFFCKMERNIDHIKFLAVYIFGTLCCRNLHQSIPVVHVWPLFLQSHWSTHSIYYMYNKNVQKMY